jgi:O-methyltransferase involved in polyketide biosynthesis
MAPGNAVVFDYAVPKTSLSPREQLRLEALAGRVAAAGEPLQLFFEPNELAQQLRQLGFRDLEDLAVSAINARYFSDRSDGLQVTSSVGRLMRAEL